MDRPAASRKQLRAIASRFTLSTGYMREMASAWLSARLLGDMNAIARSVGRTNAVLVRIQVAHATNKANFRCGSTNTLGIQESDIRSRIHSPNARKTKPSVSNIATCSIVLPSGTAANPLICRHSANSRRIEYHWIQRIVIILTCILACSEMKIITNSPLSAHLSSWSTFHDRSPSPRKPEAKPWKQGRKIRPGPLVDIHASLKANLCPSQHIGRMLKASELFTAQRSMCVTADIAERSAAMPD